MAIRVFHCPNCGHRTRLFSMRCGYCKILKPPTRQGVVWLVLTAYAAVLVMFAGVPAPYAQTAALALH